MRYIYPPIFCLILSLNSPTANSGRKMTLWTATVLVTFIAAMVAVCLCLPFPVWHFQFATLDGYSRRVTRVKLKEGVVNHQYGKLALVYFIFQ